MNTYSHACVCIHIVNIRMHVYVYVHIYMCEQINVYILRIVHTTQVVFSSKTFFVLESSPIGSVVHKVIT